MGQYNHFYKIQISFLGFRYHGWQLQKELKTVQFMVNKTIEYVLNHNSFRTIGCSRTDARVSAEEYYFQLLLKTPIKTKDFFNQFRTNLPTDITAHEIEEVGSDFNIIQAPKIKEYRYYFSIGNPAHPFTAAFMADFGNGLSLDLMKSAAELFTGTHNFKNFCSAPKTKTDFTREIISSKITPSKNYSGAFFPPESYMFQIKAKAFMRYQVRLMMGAIEMVGRKELDLESIRERLKHPSKQQIPVIAPGSGLVLHSVTY